MQLSLFLASQQAAEQFNQHLSLQPILKYAHAETQLIPTCTAYLQALGVENAHGQYPLAHLLMQQENQLPPKGGQSFVVQAVSLQLQRDAVSLAAQLTLTADEYETATQLLNQHFSEDGITLITSETQQHWYLNLAIEPVKTYLPQQALYQDVHPYQPSGEGARILKQVMNEAQMLLHEHAMNDAREAKGVLPFNSVWLSGNGQLPQTLASNCNALMGNTQLIQAIHQHTAIPVYEDLGALIQQPASNAIMHVTSLEQVDWLALYQLVKRWQLKQLQVYIAIGPETIRLTLKPIDCLKFWRQPKTFEQLIQALN